MNVVKNIRIGEVLKEYGYITDAQLQQALAYQSENRGKRLGTVLIEQGFISERQMLEALAQRMNMTIIDLSSTPIEVEVVAKIPQQLAEKYGILALNVEGQMLSVATNDPMNFYAMEDIRQLTGMDLDIHLAEKAPLERAISYYYSEVSAHKAANTANEAFQDTGMEELEMEEGDGDVPIIKLLNSLIERAYNTNASDIHIEPFEDKSLVRMRIDGTIVDYVTLQKGLHASLIARIKIVGGMDIAERRIPQDGHCKMKIGGSTINVRISVIPTVFGEKAVLRVLAGRSVISRSQSYGMKEEEFRKFNQMMRSPNGIIYITGPTGSGKTTTLYMVLEELAKKQVNISTIEDPVEKNLPRINQMQVNNQAGLTFEVGLRALLRQDPDIIMVGETRDAETARISIRAAITGHLVLSTLHTNSAVASIVRLVDMGMEPYMIANSLVGIVAQRLVRKVCPYCAVDDAPNEEELELLGPGEWRIKRARGCERCNNTGYNGRVAIHEMVVIDAKIRKMISDGTSMDTIEAYAIGKQGMKTLRTQATELVAEGVTTVDELQKVAYYS
jgi:type IV pilus assembly protein PilB